MADIGQGDTVWLQLMGSGVQERFYDAGGVRTRVLEAGEGEPLILLHGTGGHAEAYYRNIAPLSGRFRVLAVDMIGHGFSDRPAADYTLDLFAGHIARLMDALGIERANVSGESLGATVGAWLAITRPDRVNRLVLNTAVLARPDAEGQRQLEELARRTQALMAQGLSRETVRRRMEWLVSDPARMTDELVACRHRIYSQPGMLETMGRVMAAAARMWRGEAGEEYLAPGVMARIQAPTLVLWTEHNPGQSVEFARRVAAEIPRATFKVLADCGHWPQFERPEVFNRVHLEFLAGVLATER